MPLNKLNITQVAAEIGRNADVCCEFQREYITFQEIMGIPGTTRGSQWKNVCLFRSIAPWFVFRHTYPTSKNSRLLLSSSKLAAFT